MKLGDAEALIDDVLVVAIRHPIRVKALEVLSKNEASPKEVAEMIGVRLPSVSYHVSTLHKVGLLDLVRTQKRRGATEHFYRAIPRSFVGHWDWRRVPGAVRGAFDAISLSTFVNHASFALGQKEIANAPETRAGWMTVAADDVGRERLDAIARQAVAAAERVQDESLERSAKSGGTISPFVFALHLFAATGSA